MDDPVDSFDAPHPQDWSDPEVVEEHFPDIPGESLETVTEDESEKTAIYDPDGDITEWITFYPDDEVPIES